MTQMFSEHRKIKFLLSGATLIMLIACKPMGTEMTSDDQQKSNDDAPQTAEKIPFNKGSLAAAEVISSTTGLQLVSHETDALGFQHLKYQQVFKGVPIWKSDMIMHINAEQKVFRVDGQHRSVADDLNVSPTLTFLDATEKAREALAENGKNWNGEKQELVIYPDNESPTLAWVIELSSGINRKFVIIDAHNGAVLKTLEGNWS